MGGLARVSCDRLLHENRGMDLMIVLIVPSARIMLLEIGLLVSLVVWKLAVSAVKMSPVPAVRCDIVLLRGRTRFAGRASSIAAVFSGPDSVE